MTDSDILENVLLPVANDDDALSSCRALKSHVGDRRVTAVHVIEKAGGAPDKASVEQREQVAEEAFDVVREFFEDAETRIVYDTNVSEAIFDVADEIDASAIVFTPRDGNRWIRLLTGDIALKMITKGDRPVVVLPDEE